MMRSLCFDRDHHSLLVDMHATALLAGDMDAARLCNRAIAKMTYSGRERDFAPIVDWNAVSASDALAWLRREAAYVSYGYPDAGDMVWIANSMNAQLPVRLWLFRA